MKTNQPIDNFVDITTLICEFCNWTYNSYTQQVISINKETNQTYLFFWPSLDAIHEAESKLSPQQFTKYSNILCDITYNDFPDPNVEALIHLPLKTKLFAIIKVIQAAQ